MFIDASAIVAILAGEDEADALALKLDQAKRRVSSPIAIYEAALGLARIKGQSIGWALQTVEAFLTAAEVSVGAVGRADAIAALSAFDRFGKGRHPARLNLGDCFAYGCAKSRDLPLLYKGQDFSSTDIESA